MHLTGHDCRDAPGASIDPEFSPILSTARELDANSVVVFLAAGGRLETVHRWSASGHAVSNLGLLRGGPELHEVLVRAGAVRAGDPLAGALRAAIGPTSNSFVVFTRPIQKCVVAMAFGFAAEHPPHARIPPAAAERLDLAAYATWSSRQLNRLHTELQVVHQKLAGRKLVERAKALLQARHQLDEKQAYEHLRKQSRQRRITIAKLAEEVLRRSTAEIGPVPE